MYAIMAMLTTIVIILALMVANKPPVVETTASVPEAKAPEREILFNLTPPPDDDDPYLNILPLGDDEEEEDDEDDDPDIQKLDQMMYATSSVNLRTGPGTDFERIGSLSANQQVKVVGQSISSRWYKIEHRDGFAFVSGSFLEMVEDN